MKLFRCNFVMAKTVDKFVLFSKASESLNQADGFFVVGVQNARAYQIENGECESKEGDFPCIEKVIPELKSALETERPAKHRKEPLHKVGLRINAFLLQVKSHFLVVLKKQVVECFCQYEDEVRLECKQSLEERVCKHHVRKDIKRLYFAYCNSEHDDRVSHPLDVAYVRTVEMKQFKHLSYILPQTRCRLVLSPPCKRTTNVPTYLTPHFLGHPVELPSLQQLEVKLIGQGQVVFHDYWPYDVTKLVRNAFFDKGKSFLFEFAGSD